MRLDKGDYCILRGNHGGDVCVRVLGNLEPWEGAARFMGEKLGIQSKKVIVRRAFFLDEVLKKIPGLPESAESGLSQREADSID